MVDKSFIVHFVSKFTKSLIFFNSANLIHGNLKPSNVFIQFTSIDHFKLYLSDHLQYYLYNSKLIETPLPTLQFSSPEMILYKEVSISTDIWSFGNILYYFITGNVLFSSSNIKSLYISMKKEKNKDLYRLDLLLYKHLPSFIIDTIRNCIKFKPEDRISPIEILENVNKYKIKIKEEKSWYEIHQLSVHNFIYSKCILHSDSNNNNNNNLRKCIYVSGIKQYSYFLHSFRNLSELNIDSMLFNEIFFYIDIAFSPVDIKYISYSFQYISKLVLLVLSSILYIYIYIFFFLRMLFNISFYYNIVSKYQFIDQFASIKFSWKSFRL